MQTRSDGRNRPTLVIEAVETLGGLFIKILWAALFVEEGEEGFGGGDRGAGITEPGGQAIVPDAAGAAAEEKVEGKFDGNAFVVVVLSVHLVVGVCDRNPSCNAHPTFKVAGHLKASSKIMGEKFAQAYFCGY